MYSRFVRPIFVCRSTAFINATTRLKTTESSANTNIITSSFPDIQLPDLTIPDFVFQNWSKFPTRIALECGVTGKKYTFEELRRKCLNLSVHLRKRLNLKKGDVVAILLPNTPDYAVCILGALKAGLVVTTLSALNTSEEIARQLSETEAKVVVTVGPLLPLLEKCSTKTPTITVKMQPGESTPQGLISFDELIEKADDSDSIHVNPSDVAIMPFSSGTTGFPKAVQLTHKNIVANICQLNRPDIVEVLASTADHQAILPAILPYFHVAGIIPLLLMPLHNTSKIVTLPKFQPDLFIGTLEKHKPNFIVVVPYLVGFISNNPNIKTKHFERLRMMASSTAPLSAQDEDRLLQKVGQHVDFFQAYGLTETSAISAMGNTKNTSQGSVGRPLPSTAIKVVDEKGNSLGPNQPGEILIKGPQLMKGYLKKPKQTEDTFHDGWLKSGDVGYYNEKGLFYVTDRLKELIKVKGFQVAPAELEAVIRHHPAVSEVAVIGIPHSLFGEAPKAYVVLKESAHASADEIKEFVSKKVSEYKQLNGGVAFIESLPKAPTGKILRAKLRDAFKRSEL